MKKKKEITHIILLILLLSYIIFNTKSINNLVIYATKLFFYKVFPFLFIMIIINELLINNNILYYINKLFKKNGIKYYVLIMSMLSGSPTSGYIIKELYINKIINEKDAHKLLLCSSFSNPIFLISMLSYLFPKKIMIIIILCHYIPNILMCIFIRIKPNKDNIIIKSNTFNNILKKDINTCLLVLGTITSYIVISNIIINIIDISNYYKTIIKGIIELTQGLNDLNTLLISINNKSIIAILFLNFGGLSIHSQIKSIIADTNIKYRYFLFGRLISLFVTWCPAINMF